MLCSVVIVCCHELLCSAIPLESFVECSVKLRNEISHFIKLFSLLLLEKVLSWPQLFTSCHRRQRPSSSASVLLLSSFQSREPKSWNWIKFIAMESFTLSSMTTREVDNGANCTVQKCTDGRDDEFLVHDAICVYFSFNVTQKSRGDDNDDVVDYAMGGWEVENFRQRRKKENSKCIKISLFCPKLDFSIEKRMAWQREREAKNCHHPSMLPTITANLQSTHIYSSRSIVRTADDDCQ